MNGMVYIVELIYMVKVVILIFFKVFILVGYKIVKKWFSEIFMIVKIEVGMDIW